MFWLLSVAMAREAAWRWVTADQGLVSEHVNDVVQGPDGMMWIATHGGVYRWDGQRAVRQDGGALGIEVSHIVFDAAGTLHARDAYRGLWRFGPGGAVKVEAPPVDDLAVDRGRVLVLAENTAWRVTEAGLEALPVALPRWTRVLRADGATVVAGTQDAFWLVEPGLRPHKIADATIAIDAAPAGDGTWWLLDVLGTVRRVHTSGAPITEVNRTGRGLRITVRHGDAWVGYDNGFVRVGLEDSTDTWGTSRGVHTGGRIWFDDEGSLWLATFRGLGQLPDVGSALYDRDDGLPGEALRDLELVGDTLWVSGWGGLVRMPAGGGVLAPWDELVLKGRLCADGAGGVWGVGTDGPDGPARFVRIDAAGTRTWPAVSRSHFLDDCEPAGDGSVWITAADGLWRAGPDAAPRRVAEWPTRAIERETKGLAVAPDGSVWAAGGETVCHLREAWTCETLGRGAHVTDIEVTASGAPWVANALDGVLRRGAAGWEPIPGVAALPSRSVLGLARSPRGGIWVLGHGVVTRVEEDASDAGWREVETLAAWLGHLVSGAADLVELPDGGMWIAHNGGLTQVSAGSREPPSEPPGVTLLELRVDGRRVDPGADTATGPPAVAAGAPGGAVARAVLPSPRSGVLLRFVAPTWRAPSLVRYRVRVGDGAWRELGGRGELELGDLRAGRYTVEVAASLDGRRWSAEPLRVALDVPLPWHRRPTVWAGAAALVALVAMGAERARGRVERRIERLRTRVALDLHDEIGAGLGAIGLLAGLTGRADLPADARAEAAGRVARIAGALGGAMRGIVWSLRPESARMDALGRYLGEQARALLPELHHAGGLSLSLPDEPVPIDLDVLRAVQLVGLEALHNVARHAAARRVHVKLGRDARGWALVVEDDGAGLGGGVADAADAGNGLLSLRMRAEQVGGRLEIGPGAAGGTRVRLWFVSVRSRWTGRRSE